MSAAEAELQRIRERYSNRRSLAFQLVDECMAWAKVHTAEVEARSEGRIEQMQKAIDQEKASGANQRSLAAHYKKELEQKRTLAEARRALEADQVEVTISSDYSSWQLSDLEEVAYRFRSGGGTDETTVEMTKYHAKAIVPAPDMVTLTKPRIQQQDAPVLDSTHHDQGWELKPTILAGAAFAVGICLALLAAWIF